MTKVNPVRHDQFEVFVGQNLVDFLTPREGAVSLEYLFGKFEKYFDGDIKSGLNQYGLGSLLKTKG